MTAHKTILVGSHVSAAGELYKAIERAASIDCSAFQIFTKSNRSWFDKPITEQAAAQFKDTLAATPTIKSVVVHSSYLINIGSPEEDKAKQSTKALLDEVRRCQQLGIKLLVLHPGSHLKSGEEDSLKRIATALDTVLEQSEGVSIVLETMAGQGTNLGYTFEQLAAIRQQCAHKRRVSFCLDTCHVFSAGYDITTTEGYEKTITAFDSIIGLEHLTVIHLNDSQKGLASKVDRHAPLGTGHIPLATFSLIMNDKRLTQIPKLLETPSDPDMKLWAAEIKLLKGMVA
jgi:deoxyribonuclease-4